MAGEANLEFKIRADSSQARGELSRFRSQVGSELNVIKGNFGGAGVAIRQEMEGVAQSMSAGAGAVGRFAGSFGAAGLVVGAGIGAYVALGSTILDLTNKAADAGEKFDDFRTKTGLSIETASGLDLALKQNNASLDTLANGMFFLTKNQAAARQGNDQLAEAFRKLGVDLSAGPEEALRQVAAGLARTTDEGERNRLGALAMGRGYKELSLFINSTNGDLDALIEQSRKASRVMTEEAAKAAAQYKDNLDELNAQIDAVERNIGNDFVPAISRAMKTISDLLAGNSVSWQRWAFNVKDAFEIANPGIKGIGAETLGFAANGILGMGIVADARAAARQAEANRRARETGTTPGGVNVPEELQYKPRISDAELLRAAKERTERATEQAEREAARKREEARREEQRNIERAEEAKRDAYRKTIRTIEGWEKDVQREIEAVKKENERLDREMSDRRADASDAVREAIRREVAELTNENTHLNEINNTIRRAEILEAIDARTAAWLRTLAVLNEVGKEIERANEATLAGSSPVGVPILQAPGQEKGPFVDPKEFTAEFGEPPAPKFDLWKESLNGLKDVGKGVFGGLTQGFGGMVQAFLMGEKGAAKSFGAIAKAAITSMAAQAAVSALFQLAEGFAWLFINPPKAAAHFQSAAVFGIVAGMAGVASALIPGGGSDTGSAFSSSGSAFGGGGSTAQDSGPRVVEQSRNTVVEHIHTIRLEPGLVVEHVTQDVRGNGKLRGLIIETAGA